MFEPIIYPVFTVTYLQLEDITSRFHRPCIMDVKMGCITYAPDAEPEKVAREISKYPPAKETGFQLIGTRVRKMHVFCFCAFKERKNTV